MGGAEAEGDATEDALEETEVCEQYQEAEGQGGVTVGAKLQDGETRVQEEVHVHGSVVTTDSQPKQYTPVAGITRIHPYTHAYIYSYCILIRSLRPPLSVLMHSLSPQHAVPGHALATFGWGGIENGNIYYFDNRNHETIWAWMM